MPRRREPAIIPVMNQTIEPQPGIFKDQYPYTTIIVRWLFLTAEMGLGAYFAFLFGLFNLGYLYIIYGIIALTVLQPLIRCVRCYYYGKRCNIGLGKLVQLFYKKADDDNFSAYYGYSILIWPLRLIPIGVGSLQILDGLLSEFKFVPQGLFGVYLAVLFFHRRFYRAVSCSKCRQKAVCPVYDIVAMRAGMEKQGNLTEKRLHND